MAASKTAGTSYWVVILAAASVVVSIGSNILSNSKEEIKNVKIDISAQIHELKADFLKWQNDARWNYATKDFVNGRIDGIKEEEKTYRKGVEVIVGLQQRKIELGK